MLMETTADETRESTESQAPPRATEPGSELQLEQLSVADGLYLLIAFAATMMRFSGLGQIPLSPTEAKEALAAWQFLQAGQHIVEFNSPAYFTLTSLLMSFFGTNDVTARIVAAMFGLGLVLLPWLLRERLGRIGALVTATLFAVSPLLATVSRTAGGESIALFAILLATIAALRLLNDRKQQWLYVLAIALGLGLASSSLIYSGLVTFTIAWWLQRKIHPESGPIIWPERAELFKAIIIGVVVFISLSTRFLTHLSGVGAAAQLFGDWLALFSLQGDLRALLTPFLVLARYEIVLLPLGVIGILWSIWRNHPLGTLFTYWLLMCLILILLQRGVVDNALLVLLPGYLLLGLTTNHLLRRGLTHSTWAVTGILILLSAIVLVNVARFLRVSLTEQQILNLWIALMALSGAVMAIYYFWSVHEEAVLQGIWLAVLLLLLLFQWGTAWNLTHNTANDPRERWVEQATDDDVPVLISTLQDISRKATNSNADLSLYSAVDSPVLRWYLRDFWRAQFGQTIPPGAQFEAIISRSDATEPALGSDYLGSDFGLIRAGTLPSSGSSTPVLDAMRWWLFHETLNGVMEDRVILWVRTDLAYPQ
jgi:uncharacterized protein (TIGR03663 family)